MYWLKINNGFVGPFATTDALYAAYREAVSTQNVQSASVWSGQYGADHFEWVIV